MELIEIKGKRYAVPADTVLDYLKYRKTSHEATSAEDTIMLYHDNLGRYYASKHMAEDGVSLDYELLPALEDLAQQILPASKN